MADLFDLLEYLVDRSAHNLVDTISLITSSNAEKETVINSLRILQGELMTIRQICGWLKSVDRRLDR